MAEEEAAREPQSEVSCSKSLFTMLGVSLRANHGRGKPCTQKEPALELSKKLHAEVSLMLKAFYIGSREARATAAAKTKTCTRIEARTTAATRSMTKPSSMHA